MELSRKSDNDTSNEEIVRQLLDKSRQKISSGKPTEALESVIEAIRLTRGEESIIQVLDEAKARAVLTQNNLEKVENFVPKTTNSYMTAKQASEDLVQQSSLLAEIGDGSEMLLQEAFEDGSSLICTRCGGLVARERWTAHCAFWCSSAVAAASVDKDDLDD